MAARWPSPEQIGKFFLFVVINRLETVDQLPLDSETARMLMLLLPISAVVRLCSLCLSVVTSCERHNLISGLVFSCDDEDEFFDFGSFELFRPRFHFIRRFWNHIFTWNKGQATNYINTSVVIRLMRGDHWFSDVLQVAEVKCTCKSLFLCTHSLRFMFKIQFSNKICSSVAKPKSPTKEQHSWLRSCKPQVKVGWHCHGKIWYRGLWKKNLTTQVRSADK